MMADVYTTAWGFHTLALRYKSRDLFWAVHPAPWWLCTGLIDHPHTLPGLDCMEFA